MQIKNILLVTSRMFFDFFWQLEGGNRFFRTLQLHELKMIQSSSFSTTIITISNHNLNRSYHNFFFSKVAATSSG